jgi:hypothetical protein
MTIEDFKSFFQHNIESDTLNLNVMIDRVLLFFKDMFIQNKIDIKVNGDINLEISFVKGELKHILMKLIFNTIYLLKNNLVEDKKIDICFNERDEFIELEIDSNVGNVDVQKLNSYFDYNNFNIEENIKSNLGLHLVKTLIEKNLSTIHIEQTS